jgi:hypothetical protein
VDFVCGPDVTRQIAQTWQRIQDDFRTWPRAAQQLAADRIFNPLDSLSWDTLPLFLGGSDWLRDPRVNNCPCGIPLTPGKEESDQGCSDTVQVADQCWLNGTVNYGTYGIMVKLVEGLKTGAKLRAEGLITSYKISMGESPALPLAWFQATFFGGPTGIPRDAGNRPRCARTCSLDGSVVNWDYVWEPVKPRDERGPHARYDVAKPPRLNLPELPIPHRQQSPAPTIVSVPSFTRRPTYTAVRGDTLQKIAASKYGDATKWQIIYAANKQKIGPNPDLLHVNMELIIP